MSRRPTSLVNVSKASLGKCAAASDVHVDFVSVEACGVEQIVPPAPSMTIKISSCTWYRALRLTVTQLPPTLSSQGIADPDRHCCPFETGWKQRVAEKVAVSLEGFLDSKFMYNGVESHHRLAELQPLSLSCIVAHNGVTVFVSMTPTGHSRDRGQPRERRAAATGRGAGAATRERGRLVLVTVP